MQRRQGIERTGMLSSRCPGGSKTKRDQKPEGGSHFLNSILDVCSNQGAKRDDNDGMQEVLVEIKTSR